MTTVFLFVCRLFGPRDIHKKVLELPIPKYKPENDVHNRLVELGKECEAKSSSLLSKLIGRYSSLGKIRSTIRNELENELSEISELVFKIFGEVVSKNTLDDWSS